MGTGKVDFLVSLWRFRGKAGRASGISSKVLV